MKKTILMYWPVAGNVESCAKIIGEEYQNVEIKSIDHVSEADLNEAECFILGCSTVGSETWESDTNNDPWPKFFKQLDSINLTQKSVALFGLGDQIRWPRHFVDGMAVLYEQFAKKGAKIVGRWSVDGYHHEESEAMEGDFFVGLALDQDHQAELTAPRVSAWVKQIKAEF